MKFFFKQRPPHFHFAQDPAYYVAGPGATFQKMATAELLSDTALPTSAFLLWQQRERSLYLLAEKHSLWVVDSLYHACLSESFDFFFYLTLILVLACPLHPVWAIVLSSAFKSHPGSVKALSSRVLARVLNLYFDRVFPY